MLLCVFHVMQPTENVKLTLMLRPVSNHDLFPSSFPFSPGVRRVKTKVSGMLGRCYQGADTPTCEQRSSQVDGACLDCAVPLSGSGMLDHKHMLPQSHPATRHTLTSVPGNLCYSERSSNQKWVKQLPHSRHLGKPSSSTAHHSTSSGKHSWGSDDREDSLQSTGNRAALQAAWSIPTKSADAQIHYPSLRWGKLWRQGSS